ncbi:MAG: hypothetical protein DMF26_07910 [Verrucomicrobia bacterium]|nr:MAG: hypothetical protein DMF26_07910 [Verrucomicrobiota bacterium]
MAKSGLGKGLDALIGAPVAASRAEVVESGERVHQINLANIVPSALQPRKDFGSPQRARPAADKSARDLN